jgi:N-acetylglutamate synthase-like GNAT family acetyltransferase
VKDSYSTENGKCIAHILHISSTLCLLTSIRTYPVYRNSGFAREVLHQILSDADKEGVRVDLSAQSESWDNDRRPGLTQGQLEAWYLRHGFERIEPLDPRVMRR